MSFKIATWNVNSLKMRAAQVVDLLKNHDLDVLCLQETKTTDAQFDKALFADLGYQVAFSGQKAYNGVAIISKTRIHAVSTDIVGLDASERRIMAASIGHWRIVNLYVVNGSAVGSDKYAYKLQWLQKVRDFIHQQHQQFAKLVVLGDFNIAPADIDVYHPKAWQGKILCSAPERALLNSILEIGLVDAFRALYPQQTAYSWWDYRQDMFNKNQGLRIDLLLNSVDAQAKAKKVSIDTSMRSREQPSDHAPVICEYAGE